MNSQQYIRKEENHFVGKKNSYVFKTEEHSVFLDDGNIITRLKTEQPVAQGIMPHKQNDIVGECQSCFNFVTIEMHLKCQLCWQIVCSPCASQYKKLTVCPSCAQFLVRRRRNLILRKLFIDPFVEWVG